MAQEKEYFAFISYQRKDEEWADRLRSKLEHYRLPSSVRKQDASLPKEIRPIFRDALELAGGVLAKEIETALQNSKFLIVICSPNSAKSPWVNKEIQTFIDLSREDRIIPFIIDGTPFSDDEKTECFPPALRSLKGEKELLGININELSRDAASIKVVARMFGLKFDTLWQRYEREKRRRRLLIGGIVIAVAIISILITLWIWHQNVLLKDKDNKIMETNTMLQKKDWKMMENRARFANLEINKLIEDSDCYTACRVALYLLPHDLDKPDKPYLEDLEVSLREALCNNNAKIETEGMGSVTFSPDGGLIAECGFLQPTVIWDANSGALLKKIDGCYYDNEKSETISINFSDDGKKLLTHYTQGCYSLWDLNTETELSHYENAEQIPGEILMSFNNSFNAEYMGYSYVTMPKKFTKDKRRFLKRTDGYILIQNVHSDVLEKSYRSIAFDNMKLNNEGSVLIGTSKDGVSLLDLSRGYNIAFLKNAIDAVYNDKKTLALYKEDSIVHVKDIFSGKTISVFQIPDNIDYSYVKLYFDDTGDWVIAETGNLSAILFNTLTGEIIKYIDIWTEGGFISALSANRKRFATVGSLAGLCLYDMLSDTIVYKYNVDGSDLIAISDDGDRCVIGMRDVGLRLIKQHGKDDFSCLCLPLESKNANSVSFSHQSDLFVSTHADGIVRVWNSETGKLMVHLKGHQASVSSAIFLNNDRRIVSSDEKGIINVWEYLPFQELMDNARKRFKNNPLTQEELRKYYLE